MICVPGHRIYHLDRESFVTELCVWLREGFPGLHHALLDDRSEVEVCGLFLNPDDLTRPLIVIVLREPSREDTLSIGASREGKIVVKRVSAVPWERWRGDEATGLLLPGDYPSVYEQNRRETGHVAA
jgi:hypothetical protein